MISIFTRYFVIFSSDREYLKMVLDKVVFILKDVYKLNINSNKTMIVDSYHGFEYLGYIFCVRDNKTIIKRKSSNRRRMVKGIKRSKYLFDSGCISFRSYFNSMSNYGKYK